MNFIKYENWVKSVPMAIQDDSLWKMNFYWKKWSSGVME